MRRNPVSIVWLPVLLSVIALSACSGGGGGGGSAGGDGGGNVNADTSPPKILSVSPAMSSEAKLDEKIVATFSKDMDPASITQESFLVSGNNTNGQSTVSGSVAYEEAGRTATFTPDAPLSPFTSYRVVVTKAVRDLAGNALANEYQSYFYTGEAADAAEIPVVEFETESVEGDGTFGSYEVAVVLSAPPNKKDVAVDYDVQGYEETHSNKIFQGATTRQLIQIIPGTQDAVVTLSNPSNATLGKKTAFTYKVKKLTVEFESESKDVSDNDQHCIVPVKLSSPVPNGNALSATVSYSITGGMEASGYVQFLSGEQSKEIDVPLYNPTYPNTNFVVTLSNPRGLAVLGTKTVFTCKVPGGSTPPTGKLSFKVQTPQGADVPETYLGGYEFSCTTDALFEDKCLLQLSALREGNVVPITEASSEWMWRKYGEYYEYSCSGSSGCPQEELTTNNGVTTIKFTGMSFVPSSSQLHVTLKIEDQQRELLFKVALEPRHKNIKLVVKDSDGDPVQEYYERVICSYRDIAAEKCSVTVETVGDTGTGALTLCGEDALSPMSCEIETDERIDIQPLERGKWKVSFAHSAGHEMDDEGVEITPLVYDGNDVGTSKYLGSAIDVPFLLTPLVEILPIEPENSYMAPYVSGCVVGNGCEKVAYVVNTTAKVNNAPADKKLVVSSDDPAVSAMVKDWFCSEENDRCSGLVFASVNAEGNHILTFSVSDSKASKKWETEDFIHALSPLSLKDGQGNDFNVGRPFVCEGDSTCTLTIPTSKTGTFHDDQNFTPCDLHDQNGKRVPLLSTDGQTLSLPPASKYGAYACEFNISITKNANANEYDWYRLAVRATPPTLVVRYGDENGKVLNDGDVISCAASSCRFNVSFGKDAVSTPGNFYLDVYRSEGLYDIKNVAHSTHESPPSSQENFSQNVTIGNDATPGYYGLELYFTMEREGSSHHQYYKTLIVHVTPKKSVFEKIKEWLHLTPVDAATINPAF